MKRAIFSSAVHRYDYEVAHNTVKIRRSSGRSDPHRTADSRDTHKLGGALLVALGVALLDLLFVAGRRLDGDGRRRRRRGAQGQGRQLQQRSRVTQPLQREQHLGRADAGQQQHSSRTAPHLQSAGRGRGRSTGSCGVCLPTPAAGEGT